MLFCRNGRGDSLTVEGRVVAPESSESTSAWRSRSRRALINANRAVRRESRRRRARVRRPARPPPYSRPRGRGDTRFGTRAAAAGGYCAILGIPNTDPVVGLRGRTGCAGRAGARGRDRADRLHGGHQQGSARRRAGGSWSSLRPTGAAAFTDDGLPVVSAGLLRRALQYSGLAGRPLALHCEDPSLSRGGHAHEGAVSAELGLGPYPSPAESVMVERDLASRRGRRSARCT